MTHGSLFSGIGGFDLAAQMIGWQNIFQVEIDDYCQRVLQKNFPHTHKHKDIKDFTAHEYTNTIDVISGGFPCQPFSVAGQRRGKADDRYLWQEMLRVIATIKPTYVVGENVTGIINLALDTVLSDLEAQDYTTETFIIPACSQNAWHKRDRVWIVAHTNSLRRQNAQNQYSQPLHDTKRHDKTAQQVRQKQQCRTGKSSIIFSDPTSRRQSRQRECNIGCSPTQNRERETNNIIANGFYREWQTEPGVGRVADGIPNRVDRLKGLGNAIVPQIAFEIFKAIQSIHHENLY